MDEYFVTPSGTTIRLEETGFRRPHHRDALEVVFQVSSTGSTRRCAVALDAPALIDAALHHQEEHPVARLSRTNIPRLAVLTAVDQDPDFFADVAVEYRIDVGPANVLSLGRGQPLSERELRRYIVRRVFDSARRATLDVEVRFSELDFAQTGATMTDFLRCSQVLAEDGYLRLGRLADTEEFFVTPTSLLIREVERHGAAREDLEDEQDYERSLGAFGIPVERRAAILREYARYQSASTSLEVASVFRSVAPLVEGLLRDALRAAGATREFPNLGSMIHELQNRGLGDRALIAQLNHILKFARDFEGHGHEMPASVMRIACANAFELVPKIGALADWT